MREIDAVAVLALARECGQDWIDVETATRIASGASASVRAVLELGDPLDASMARGSLPTGLAHGSAPTGATPGERDAAAFLADLARLAEQR